jgi:Na+/melibiose symporter-like transporter
MTGDAFPWAERLYGRWGHFAPELLMGSIGAVILLGLHPVYGPLALSVSFGLVVFVVMSWLLMRRHDRSLCEHCVAAMPLNPSELAARYSRRFWLSHTGAEPKFVVPYLAVLIGSNFATGTVGRFGWAVVQTSMIYLILSYSTHRRLQPWCPWCREGGGGWDADNIDSPDPVPGDRRQLI